MSLCWMFWVVTLCTLLKLNRYFGVICGLHLQGRQVNQAKIQHESGNKQVSCWLKLITLRGVVPQKTELCTYF
jgi:hypothetical protein